MKSTIAAIIFGLLLLCGCSLVPAVVTLDKYERLQNGMSYGDVIGIIGNAGEEVSRVTLPDTPSTVMYSWKNLSGSNMNAMFQDNKLVMKAQAGLK